MGVPERFIVSKCHELVEKVTNDIEAYDMSDAGFAIYQFLWDEYADWYDEGMVVVVVLVHIKYLCSINPMCVVIHFNILGWAVPLLFPLTSL